MEAQKTEQNTENMPLMANNNTEPEKSKTPEEWHLKFAKENLEHKKYVYENYLKVCIKYAMPELGYYAIMADELYSKDLLRLMDNARKNGKFISELLFGKPGDKKLTEIEIINEKEKCYDKLIQLARNRINEFDYETKIKVAHDSIEKFHAWFNLPTFSDNTQNTSSAEDVLKPSSGEEKTSEDIAS